MHTLGASIAIATDGSNSNQLTVGYKRQIQGIPMQQWIRQ